GAGGELGDHGRGAAGRGRCGAQREARQMTLAIETNDVRYKAGRSFEIARLNMHVPRGAVYGFLGPNGSGKTTTIRLLLALLAPAQKPELLVLDEPTDGLDPVVRRDILAAVLDYVTDRDATVLISSHLVHELERICDWVGVMDRGNLIAEMPMNEFKNGLKR